MKKILKTILNSIILKLTISILFLVYILGTVEIKSVLDKISRISILVLAEFLILNIIVTWLASGRWALFLKTPKKFSDLWPYFRSNMLAYFYNLFLPSSSGGDAVKWVSLMKQGFSRDRLIFSVIMDKIIGIISIIELGFLGLLIARSNGGLELDFKVNVLFSVSFGISLLFWFYVYLPVRIGNIKIFNRFSLLNKVEDYLKSNQKTMLTTFGLSIIIQIIAYYSIYLLSSDLGLPIGFSDILVYGSIISVVLILPISFSGLGVAEASYLYFYTQLGASREGVLALTSIMIAFKIVLAMIGWLMDFGYKIWGFKLKNGARMNS